MPDDRRVRIAQETLDIYAPIANRLGMSQHQERARGAVVQVPRADGVRVAAHPGRGQAPAPPQGMIEQLAADIRSKLSEAQVPVISIDGRVKRLYSIWLKLKAPEDRSRAGLRLRRAPHRHAEREGLLRRARHHPPDLVAGARPHQGFHRDAAAQRLPVAAHLGDQRSRVSVRGADSHRRNAPARGRRHRRALEVQGRPRRRRQRDEQYFQWLRQLLEWQQEVRDPQEFLSNLKIDLYPEEVYTFTPRGTVKVLPKGSTAIDFAYAIHTDVGHQCVGARVNGRMVPLRTRLKNGDIVEIVAQPDAQAQPRLAELRRHLARAQQDQAPDPGRGEGARRRARPAACSTRKRAASASTARSCSKASRRKVLTELARRQGRRSARADRLRQAVAAAGARQDRPAGSAEGAGARSTRSCRR